jgi:hypothetical protein
VHGPVVLEHVVSDRVAARSAAAQRHEDEAEQEPEAEQEGDGEQHGQVVSNITMPDTTVVLLRPA